MNDAPLTKSKNRVILILLIVLCQGVGILGALVTSPNVDTWYAELVKPSFNPEGWIFGPVWTSLYFMMAVACWRVIVSRRNGPKRTALVLFGLQLGANAAWSPLFFGMRNPFAAFIDIILLWILFLLTLRWFWRVSRNAALWLVPYLAWVSFAAVLNFSIWRMNL